MMTCHSACNFRKQAAGFYAGKDSTNQEVGRGHAKAISVLIEQPAYNAWAERLDGLSRKRTYVP